MFDDRFCILIDHHTSRARTVHGGEVGAELMGHGVGLGEASRVDTSQSRAEARAQTREVHGPSPRAEREACRIPDNCDCPAGPIQWRFAIEPRFISIPVRVRAGLRRGPRRTGDCSSFGGEETPAFAFHSERDRAAAGSRAGPACRAARGSARRAARGRGCAFLVIESRSKSELRSYLCTPLRSTH